MLGVLGGMGPLATVDFLAKVVTSTPATGDAGHIPLVVRSVPQIPDRNAAVLGQGDSPLEMLCAEARALKDGGATVGVMPCNTAHHWFDELSTAVDLEFIHIADAAIAALDSQGVAGQTVGLLGTLGTLKSGSSTKFSASSAAAAASIRMSISPWTVSAKSSTTSTGRSLRIQGR